MNKGDYTIYITSIVKGIQFMNKSKQEEHAYLPKSRLWVMDTRHGG